jgi:hypothetical protein
MPYIHNKHDKITQLINDTNLGWQELSPEVCHEATQRYGRKEY